jgi:aromatic-L-amino-acid decarboxylase
LTSALDVTPFYLRTAQATSGLVIDFRNWQIPLGRRFRSLKIWYVLRSFGTNGFRAHLRKLIDLAKYFEEIVKSEKGIEMFTPRAFSMVVFRILDTESGNLEVENKLNAAFIKRSNEEHKIMLTQTQVGGKQCVRVAIGSRETQERHLKESWEGIIKPLIQQARDDVKVSLKRL